LPNNQDPTDQAEALRDYLTLRQRLDREISNFLKPGTVKLKCAPGCDSCCVPFSLCEIEAAVVLDALNRGLAEETFARATLEEGLVNEKTCALLDEGRCLIYPQRPIICRTQGLPLAYIDHERESIEFSICPKNDEAGREWRMEELFLMDPFNASLQELNRQFAPSLAGRRSKIRDLVRRALA